MELTKFPLEIICEIATKLSLDDLKRFENALDIEVPDYVFNDKYKEKFSQSIDKIKQIQYFIDRNGDSSRSQYNKGTCNNATFRLRVVKTRNRVLEKSIIINRNCKQYNQPLGRVIADINPTDYPKRVQIKANYCPLVFYNEIIDNYCFKIEN